MPEVAGDAAFLVDPLDPEAIASAMHCLATDRAFAAQLRHKGRARVEDFRWDACARQVQKVYSQIARSAPRGQKRLVPGNRLKLVAPPFPSK